MAEELENVGLFIQATLEEFWDKYPEQYSMFLGLIGHRIQQVQRDELTEKGYVTHWIQVGKEKLEKVTPVT